MAFEFFNEFSSVAIDHQDEPIFEFMRNRENLTIFPQLDANFFGRFTITQGMLPCFLDELECASNDYAKKRAAELIREKQIRASDPNIVCKILERLLQDDPIILKFEELLEFCKCSIAKACPIECVGD